MEFLRELTDTELDAVSGGAAAAAAAGPATAAAAAAHNLGIATLGGVTAINFSANLISAGGASAGSPTTDVAVAGAT